MKDAVKLQKFSDWQVHLALFSICSAVHPSFCHSVSAIILARLQPRSVPSNQHFVNTVIFLTADQIGREGGGYIPCILPPAYQSVISYYGSSQASLGAARRRGGAAAGNTNNSIGTCVLSKTADLNATCTDAYATRTVTVRDRRLIRMIDHWTDSCQLTLTSTD